MKRALILLAGINIVLVSVEVLVLSRRSWNVLCWRNHLSVGLADMVRHSTSFWKGPSHLQLPFDPSSW